MKSATTGTIAGCLVWVMACGAISMCILPVSFVTSMFTSHSDYAIQQTGVIVCPDNTTPDVRTYATTTTDENGNRQPSTAYVLQCVDAGGNVVKEDPVGYAFLWVGIFAAIGLVISGLLAFILAAPAGMLISKLFNSMKRQNIAENMEPL